jgi:NADH dehydrogenase
MSPILAETEPDKAPSVVEASRRERKRIVIIGAGFAGIAAARARHSTSTSF